MSYTVLYLIVFRRLKMSRKATIPVIFNKQIQKLINNS